MATRVQLLVEEVLENVEATGAKVKRNRILMALDKAQQEVCQKGMALEGEDKITLGTGKKVYELDINLYRIKSIIEPDIWCRPLEIIENMERWRELVRNRRVTSSHPLYCTVWAGMFRCTPAPSIDGEELAIFGYRLPEKVLTENTKDPEVSAAWDDAMIAFATGRLLKEAPKGPHMVEFEMELDKVTAQSVTRTAAGALKRQHWSDGLGF
jgi:hypothetical protein